MKKAITLGAVTALISGIGAVALADGTLRAPPGLHAPTGLPAPPGLNAVGAGIGACAVPQCDAADLNCSAIAFEAAVTCLQLGALDTCDHCLPSPNTTFFTARGHGITLIGSVGLGTQRETLRGLHEALDPRR